MNKNKKESEQTISQGIIDVKETEKQKILAENPTGWKVIVREFKKDKLALFSFVVLVTLLLTIFIWSLFLDPTEVMKVDIFNKYTPPGEGGYVLGADHGGRPILSMMILGAKNSIIVGLSITVITTLIGILLGLCGGYFGGKVDNWIMRTIDFINILPILMIIIVFVTIIPNYTIFHFILIMSAFYWTGITRLVRSKALSEARRDYVSASKTMGTSHLKIMFNGILPNIASIIIVDATLTLAGNIGIETGLTFLGFGFPPDKASLGTLISYARSADVLVSKPYVWVPASLLILVMMLSINYVGQALKRASDAKQRLG
ncbi:MAG: ABC transporter permease [Filifactoraceae bacterium]